MWGALGLPGRLALVFVWGGVWRGGRDLISVFRGVSAGVVGGPGHWVIILCGLDIFLMFPNFLRS